MEDLRLKPGEEIGHGDAWRRLAPMSAETVYSACYAFERAKLPDGKLEEARNRAALAVQSYLAAIGGAQILDEHR